MTACVASWLVCVSVGLAQGRHEGGEPRPGTIHWKGRVPVAVRKSPLPVIEVWTQHWGFSVPVSNRYPRAILAVWADGLTIWSEDSIKGGPPYMQGTNSIGKVGEVLGLIEQRGYFDEAHLREPHFAPDTYFTGMALTNDGKSLLMRSCHELVETNGSAVATSTGIVPLGSRSRMEVLSTDNDTYRAYRKTWSYIRDTLADLIPPKGTPCDVDFGF